MTFTEALENLDAAASAGLFTGYGPRPIPHELDELPERVVEAYSSALGHERELLACLSRLSVRVLAVFGERFASLAVRRRSCEVLRNSTVALGLAATAGDDEQEVVMVLALAWRSAELLGVEPALAFSEAARIVPPRGREAISAFAARDHENRRIGAMGYAESRDDQGFRYVRNW